jgi:hypothetical protein
LIKEQEKDMPNTETALPKVNVGKEIVMGAVMGFAMSAIVSALLSYFVTPAPTDTASHVIDNVITGGLSGIMTAIACLGVFFFKTRRADKKADG